MTNIWKYTVENNFEKKWIVFQLWYQRSDPLFRDPRNVPPEEEEENSEGSGTTQKVGKVEPQYSSKNSNSPQRTSQKISELSRRFAEADIAEEHGEGADGIMKISPVKSRNFRVKAELQKI